MHASTSDTSVPSEEGQPPPLRRFGDFFTKLYAGRPVPPAATSEDWLKHVHPAPLPVNDNLARPLTWWEIEPVIFPFFDYSNFQCPSDGAPDPNCTTCATMKAESANWKGFSDAANDPPSHKPRGKAQSGVNGPCLAHISWARHPKYSIRGFRKRICMHIATVLNSALEEQKMPPGSTNYKSVPLRKRAPDNEPPPNWADPASSWRFITMSPLLTKILCLALDARLVHYLTKNKIIDLSSQGASTPYLPTEWHVHALLETITLEQRHRDLYLLFIDWKKAYDNVHPEMLAAQLTRIGVPPSLVALMTHWAQTRTTTLHVNGEATAPIPTRAGVGQGDVFSCILYNIFINSLHNYLKAEGLSITPTPGINLTLLEFVDDGLSLNNSADAAERAIRAIKRWGDAFGHELNLKPSKTSVLHIPRLGPPRPIFHVTPLATAPRAPSTAPPAANTTGAPMPSAPATQLTSAPTTAPQNPTTVSLTITTTATPPATAATATATITPTTPTAPAPTKPQQLLPTAPQPPPQITLEDGTVVHYVSSYKYLGIKLYTDRTKTILDYTMKLINDMKASHSRFFGYNSILATLSPTSVVQLLKSACINNYLLSIIPSSTESITALGAPLRNIMRTALHGLPNGTPTSFLTVESNIPSATFLLTRAHLTHFLSTTTTNHDTAPAAALMRTQLTRALLQGGAPSLPINSWLATTSRHMATPAAAGPLDLHHQHPQPPPQPHYYPQ